MIIVSRCEHVFTKGLSVLTEHRLHAAFPMGRETHKWVYKILFTNCHLDKVYFKPTKIWYSVFCLQGLLQGINPSIMVNIMKIGILILLIDIFNKLCWPCKCVILLSWWVLPLQVWLDLIDKAVKETDESQIFHNLEAQHRYLTWRAEKVVWIYLKTFI